MLLCAISLLAQAQTKSQVENIIIVTTDGFRWQEVFNGMDSAIANMPEFNQDKKNDLYSLYGAATPAERRNRLLPFIWQTMAKEGQVYGNRRLDNKVSNANPYWFSYPGYSEIFCGYVDTAINTNSYPPNPHTNVLEFLNSKEAFKGKVAAFGAWEAFNRILNEQRSGLPIVCGMDLCGGDKPDAEETLINQMKQDGFNPFDQSEALDVYTHYAAMDYLKKRAPRVLYISYGETDEWAHEGHYKNYLDAAHRVDKWLDDLWAYIQRTPQYRNKTALFVTVDHGRGDQEKKQWTSHNSKIPRSYEIWFAAIGPGISALGEISAPMQLYQKQFAQTFAELLGYTFTCEHPVAPGIKDLLTKQK